MQWWFKKFCKGDESLEDEERSGQPSEVDHDQLWWSSYSFPRSCRAQLNVTRSTVVRHLKQIGRVKKVDKWVPHELTKNLKHCHFWSVIFSYSMKQQFLDWIVMCNEKWIVCDKQRWPAQWLDREKAPKHFTKPNLHYRKGHGHYLVVCCWSDPLQLSESWGNHYLWEVCLMKVKVLVAQSCLTLCDPVDCSPSGPSVHGVLPARILEWVAMPFSRGSSQPRDQT